MAKKADFPDPFYRFCSYFTGSKFQMTKKLALLIACAFVFCTGCSGNTAVADTAFVMDTFFSQSYYGDKSIAEENVQIVSRIEKEMSKTLEGSDIYTLNLQGSYQMGGETIEVVRRALDVANRTQGAFNPALNPIIELWGIGERDTDIVPAQNEIDSLLPLTDYRDVTVDPEGTVRLARGGGLDLGGIAKGYALDKTAENMRRNGVSSALIDLGGSIAVVGKKPDGRKYKIGVRDPLGGENDYIATVELEDIYTSTSGVYEKYFIKDGVRYHHILDSNTGRPAESGLLAVMIVSSSGILSDAYSTALFVMGADKGLPFANENGIDALFVTDDKQIIMTNGFAEKYNFQLAADYEIV